jgi:hypothetical protein
MTVAELKEILSKYDDNKQVVFYIGMRGMEDVFTYASAETKEKVWSDNLEDDYPEDKALWDERVEAGAVCFDLDY